MTELPRNKREKFLPAEDEKLHLLVEKHGLSCWESVAAEMPGRNARQCRERWKHYLSGERGKEPWSDAEDRLLFEKMQTIGPRWTQLAIFFPGRTDSDVKSHWMQTFAAYSSLHIANRRKAMPRFEPTIPLASRPPQVHFVAIAPGPPIPKQASSHGEEYFATASREASFGSRSFFDFTQWGE
jgi:hypothetical protein